MAAQLEAGRVSIRPATSADLATILEFRLAMLADVFGAGTRPGAEPGALRASNERWLGERFGRDFAAWIADLDGRPAASAGLMWFPHPPGTANPIGLEAYILNVYTRPEARRMGLARALMERAVEAARAAGVRRIWLRASDEGRPLYQDMGFVTSSYLELTPED
jgi:GNAT superfamily N-acetyltransferase